MGPAASPLPFLTPQSQGQEAGSTRASCRGSLSFWLPALHRPRCPLVCVAEKLLSKQMGISHGLDAPWWPLEAPRPARLIYKEAHGVRPGQQPLATQSGGSILRTLVTERTGWCPALGVEHQAERLMGPRLSQKGSGLPFGRICSPSVRRSSEFHEDGTCPG